MVREGSIYTVEQETVKTPAGNLKVQHAVAFNVGGVAEHIVDLHNRTLNHALVAELEYAPA